MKNFKRNGPNISENMKDMEKSKKLNGSEEAIFSEVAFISFWCLHLEQHDQNVTPSKPFNFYLKHFFESFIFSEIFGSLRLKFFTLYIYHPFSIYMKIYMKNINLEKACWAKIELRQVIRKSNHKCVKMNSIHPLDI